jgi:hypothetical protein
MREGHAGGGEDLAGVVEHRLRLCGQVAFDDRVVLAVARHQPREE